MPRYYADTFAAQNPQSLTLLLTERVHSGAQELSRWLSERGHLSHLAEIRQAMAKAHIAPPDIVPLLSGAPNKPKKNNAEKHRLEAAKS